MLKKLYVLIVRLRFLFPCYINLTVILPSHMLAVSVPSRGTCLSIVKVLCYITEESLVAVFSVHFQHQKESIPDPENEYKVPLTFT